MSTQSALPTLLRGFFEDYLAAQRDVSANTIYAYRDSIKLLLRFAARRSGRQVIRLRLVDLGADTVLAFLGHLESERKNCTATRNCRLVAIHRLFAYVADRDPRHADLCRRVLDIPVKKTVSSTMTYLDRDEMKALLAVSTQSHRLGPRDLALLKRRDDGDQPDAPLFLNAHSKRLSRFGVGVVIKRHIAEATKLQPSLAAKRISPHSLRHTAQVLGGVAMIGLVAFVLRRGTISLPFAKGLRSDHELQVFSAFVICFGFASLTALAQLSTALGAFVAGIVVASARETEWIHKSLDPLRVLLVALFFVSIGMLIDLGFLVDHWYVVGGLVVIVLLANTLLNAGILRALGRPWHKALYIGSLLAQVGEFSFVLAAVGLQSEQITDYGYQLAVGLIALSLLVSPAWIALVKRVVARPVQPEGGQ